VKAGKVTDRGTVVPVHAMNAYGWKRGIAPPILDLGTRWEKLGRFTPCPFYLCRKNPLYPLNRRLGGPQRQSRHFGEMKVFFLSQDLNPSLSRLWPCHYTHYTKTRNVYQIQLGNPKGRHCLVDLDMDGV